MCRQIQTATQSSISLIPHPQDTLQNLLVSPSINGLTSNGYIGPHPDKRREDRTIYRPDGTLARFLPPEDELDEQFILAGGPGGQHVNRTATAVQLRYDVPHSGFLPEWVKTRLLELAGRRADGDGVITIEAKSHRSQHRNRSEARERLAELIEKAHHRPKKRIPTRPGPAAKKRWKKKKQRHKEIKLTRRKPRLDE